MAINLEIQIFDFVWAISEAVDLMSPVLNSHHKRVAYISGSLAREMGLPDDEVRDTVLAAMLHDIGAFSKKEREMIQSYDQKGLDLRQHAFVGYKLLRCFEPLVGAAELIRYHHNTYHKLRDDISIGSYIIQLADRIAVQFDEHHEVLEQISGIRTNIFRAKESFQPDTLAAFERLAQKEYFWIEAFSPLSCGDMAKNICLSKESLDWETLRGFARVIAQIIDFQSRFTATHSRGVAAVARELSAFSGFPERECQMIEIAGFLHDLGKLTVSNDILEKNGALDNREIYVIRKHTYYTYAVLSKIRGLEHIAVWAAHHHERPDGNGYPFHVKGEDFSKLSRIMAVADIVTALTEDRPYRAGMDREKVISTLRSMAKNGAIDRDAVELVSDHFPLINHIRVQAQQEALKEYDMFHAHVS